MKIQVFSQGPGKKNINDFVSAIAASDLSPFAEQIRTAKVALSDMNGPKGGLDLECRIAVKLRSKGSLYARARGYGPLDAATLALERMMRQLREQKPERWRDNSGARRLKKQQEEMVLAMSSGF